MVLNNRTFQWSGFPNIHPSVTIVHFGKCQRRVIKLLMNCPSLMEPFQPEQIIQESEKEPIFGDNKTRASKRTIKSTPTNAEVLRQLWETSKNRDHDDLVFAADGEPPKPQSITGAGRQVVKKPPSL
jgi:hypothetical protein